MSISDDDSQDPLCPLISIVWPIQVKEVGFTCDLWVQIEQKLEPTFFVIWPNKMSKFINNDFRQKNMPITSFFPFDF